MKANSKLILGDCLEKMKELPDGSVDAVITDPPYGLEFMGKDWDKPSNLMGTRDAKTDSSIGRDNDPFIGARVNRYFAGTSFQNWCKLWATEALRVLKSGGFLFSFGGARTHHRLACGIEDAGFIIRDNIAWCYASGFPKAQELGMLIEKKLGGEGIETGELNKNTIGRTTLGQIQMRSSNKPEIKIPSLPLAKEWQGWKTPALKPCYEPITVAQKPCEGSITKNVLKYGIGGFNIDACRIPYKNEYDLEEVKKQDESFLQSETPTGNSLTHGEMLRSHLPSTNDKGRYPPNLLSEDGVLDNGQPTTQGHWAKSKITGYGNFGGGTEEYFGVGEKEQADSLNRYFDLDSWWEQQIKNLPEEARGTFPFLYCLKAHKTEKNKGLEEFKNGEIYPQNNSIERKEINATANQKTKCIHPTVKPIKICTYLIKLCTREGATVLDPFMGSGTTGIACHLTGRKFIGIEKYEEYYKIAEARIKESEKQNKLGGWL